MFSTGLFAQKNTFNYDHEIIYQYSFKPNQTDTTSLIENVLLFCNDKDFYFTSAKNYNKDETIYNGGGAKLMAQQYAGAYKPSKVTHYIFTKDNSTTTLELVNNRSFSYDEKLELKWEILPDTIHIKGYNCQKAILTYGNRKWIAWFASEIPLVMGPYKFNGLPGLVLKMTDNQQQFNWEMISFRKVNTTIPWVYFYKTKNLETVTKKEYFEYRNKRLIDPYTYDMVLNPKIKHITSANTEAIRSTYNKKEKIKIVEDNWIEIE